MPPGPQVAERDKQLKAALAQLAAQEQMGDAHRREGEGLRAGMQQDMVGAAGARRGRAVQYSTVRRAGVEHDSAWPRGDGCGGRDVRPHAPTPPRTRTHAREHTPTPTRTRTHAREHTHREHTHRAGQVSREQVAEMERLYEEMIDKLQVGRPRLRRSSAAPIYVHTSHTLPPR